MKNSLIINLKGKLQKPAIFLRCQMRRFWLGHLLIEILCVAEELVNSTAIIDHSIKLKPDMEVVILSVLHVSPEKHPTENGVIAGKLYSH